MSDYIPKWHRELSIFCRVTPVIMLEGNILDSYQYPVEGSTPKGSILRLPAYLHFFFHDLGYQNVIMYDNLRGFGNDIDEDEVRRFAELTETKAEKGRIKADFSGQKHEASSIMRRALAQRQTAVAIIVNLASRCIVSPSNLERSETDSMELLQHASLESRDVRTEKSVLKNILVLIVNKVNDLPAWFYLDNPNVKPIVLQTPSRDEREMLIKGDNFASFFDKDIYAEDMPFFEEHRDQLDKIQEKFAALTEGFCFTELNGLRRLCKNERIRIKDMCDVIDLYKYGIKDNPWKSLDLESLKNAGDSFRRRVKGQDQAISKTLDVVKRAVTGLSGLQHSSHSKPKGVLFYAGPTGTGKTETAKTLAEMLFGDESCCIRFDMSEYSQSHSDQKLLGAPPGYVGYEAGGQLTNAIKQNPFSILLFDEIEKANPTILDKFLQILEDGRMTDGQGNTVYFSECIIIFTSNLGMFVRTNDGRRVPNATSDMDYDTVRRRVRRAIEDYFKLELGRPEILNRIGENIVVFDFIRPEAARSILWAQVDKIVKKLDVEKHITLKLSDEARQILEERVLGNLDNGGRGIGNIVESLLINPLARYLFDNSVFERAKVTINSINADLFPAELDASAVSKGA